MSLALPFKGALSTDGPVFEIDQTGQGGLTGQGGTAILGNSTGLSIVGDPGVGVSGESDVGTGVYGHSDSGNGVVGQTGNAKASGVWGDNTGAGNGVSGSSVDGNGIAGDSKTNDAVVGRSPAATHSGVWGNNTGAGNGVSGSSSSGMGVAGTSTTGTGVYGKGNPAGYFSGDLQVTGDVILVNSNGDVSEDFDIEDGSALVEPGTVLVINDNGKLGASTDPYDSRVAGVVAGAGGLKPAIVLQRVESSIKRSPIALIGKAFCKVDASCGSIRPGDLLTTSSTPGHAMKVLDHTRATGAILGKALDSLQEGRGLIPILVSPR